ncbi:hypothetical protein ACFQZZ_08000 [Nocardia sp. GCM10030253]|uniref:hypothetical protein n=1 Tax=Nocardia sp. GCM10030253 TaxID=3273404 RepID=UPI00363DCD56
MLHNTTFGDHTVLWKIVHGAHQIRIESLIDHDGTTAAYRMRSDGSIVDIRNGDPGVVLFGEGNDRPDLPQVREWFPRLFGLWNAVRAQYWDAVSPLDHPRYIGPCDSMPEGGNGGCNAGRMDELPYAVRHSV